MFGERAPTLGRNRLLVGANVTSINFTTLRGRPIKDLNSAKVQEVAQFAVSEHNKQANDKLQYQKVVRGHTQVVAGTNYRLVIAAKDGAVLGNYEAFVWDKPWEQFRNLTSFQKV